jgi:hypothetical protein
MTHLLPIGRQEDTGCCHRPLKELPKEDDVTDDEALVTCPEMQR